MSDWWWADYVESHFRVELARWCERTDDDSSLTVIIEMADEDGHWAAWLRLSPVAGSRDWCRVLIDTDSNLFGFRLHLGRPAGVDTMTVVVNQSGHHQVLGPEETYDFGRASEAVERHPQRVKQTGDLARELCLRFGGSDAMGEEDGVWGFTIPVVVHRT